MNTKQLWITLGAVAGVAAIIAWFYAPGGEDRRKKLTEASQEAGEYLADAADYLKDRAERLGREAGTAYSNAAGAVSDVATETAKDLGDAVAQYAQNTPSLASTIKSMV